MLTRKPLRSRKPMNRRAPPKPPSVLHPDKPIRLRGGDMNALRMAVFQRAGGSGYYQAAKCGNCNRKIWWAAMYPGQESMQLHHLKARVHGGSDTLENCQAWCHDCHMGKPDSAHPGPQ